MNYPLIIAIIVIAIFLIWAIALSQTPSLPYTCVKHCDGDTSHFRTGDTTYVVRYAYMDADESDHPYGKIAEQKLTDLIPIGSQVNLYFLGKDRYQRYVAVVSTRTHNVNFEMVANGHAIAETGYLGDQETKAKFVEAEKLARSPKLGRWSKKEYCRITPKEWRKSHK